MRNRHRYYNLNEEDFGDGLDSMGSLDSADMVGGVDTSLSDAGSDTSNSGGDFKLSESQISRIILKVADRLLKESSKENLKDSDWNIEDHKRATLKRVGTKKNGTPKMGSKKKSDAKKSIIKKQTDSAIKKGRNCITKGSLEQCATDGDCAKEALEESIYNIKKLMLG